MRFTRCVLPQGQASTFVNCILFLMCNILFAPVLYRASINESSASHLRSDHERISGFPTWFHKLPAFSFSLRPFSFPFLIHFQLTPAWLHFSISCLYIVFFPLLTQFLTPCFARLHYSTMHSPCSVISCHTHALATCAIALELWYCARAVASPPAMVGCKLAYCPSRITVILAGRISSASIFFPFNMYLRYFTLF